MFLRISAAAVLPLTTIAVGAAELSFSRIDLNAELASNRQVVGPAVESGTWEISGATGIYRWWTGGGNWASVTSGYGNVRYVTTS
jgi:hypothetical protein